MGGSPLRLRLPQTVLYVTRRGRCCILQQGGRLKNDKGCNRRQFWEGGLLLRLKLPEVRERLTSSAQIVLAVAKGGGEIVVSERKHN